MVVRVGNKLYTHLRGPMGQKFMVFVAHTVSRVLAHTTKVRYDVITDNVKTFLRFTGTSRRLVVVVWRGGAVILNFFSRNIVEIFKKYFYDHAIIRSSS